MKRLSLLLALILGFSLPSSAYAVQKPIKLGQYSYWAAYKLGKGRKTVCYMSLVAKPPKPRKRAAKQRGDVNLMITHRPSEGTLDVVSYSVGGMLKPGSTVNVVLGNKKFNLFTNVDTVWSRETATDHALSMAIRAGSFVSFLGYLKSGGKFADTVNLKGSAKAYEMMSKACGVKVLKVPASARPVYSKRRK